VRVFCGCFLLFLSMGPWLSLCHFLCLATVALLTPQRVFVRSANLPLRHRRWYTLYVCLYMLEDLPSRAAAVCAVSTRSSNRTLSQVRHARDTELEEWSRDNYCVPCSRTKIAACFVCPASFSYELLPFVCGVVFFLLFFTHTRVPGLVGAENDLAAAPQALTHSRRMFLRGGWCARPRRSCLCLFEPCPPSPPSSCWSQVRHTQDTELEEWNRDRCCTPDSCTHSAAFPVCVVSLSLTLLLFVCSVLFPPCCFSLTYMLYSAPARNTMQLPHHRH
jgi:hypothetical protein